MPQMHSPHAERNREPILEVLERELPGSGKVLEIASGSGQHVQFFAEALPELSWQPTDFDPRALQSIASYRRESKAGNLLEPLPLDVTQHPWPVENAQALLCFNMIHIAPWSCAEALFEGAKCVLDDGAPLVIYGPFRFNGEFAAPSNADFDLWLKAKDPSYGVRDLTALEHLGHAAGLKLTRIQAMPANNHTLVFRRAD